MAQLLVRGLDDSEVLRLKQLARDNERSLEAEARLALRQWALRATSGERARANAEFAELAARMRKELEGRWTGDSADLIREDRDSR